MPLDRYKQLDVLKNKVPDPQITIPQKFEITTQQYTHGIQINCFQESEFYRPTKLDQILTKTAEYKESQIKIMMSKANYTDIHKVKKSRGRKRYKQEVEQDMQVKQINCDVIKVDNILKYDNYAILGNEQQINLQKNSITYNGFRKKQFLKQLEKEQTEEQWRYKV